MTGNKLKTFFLLATLAFATISKAQSITVLQQGKPTSIRGLCVVNDKIAWISGSKGYIALTTNGGKTWAWQQVKGYETADFRGIEAFSAKEAIIMASGTPALVLKTTDGGLSWGLKYKNTDTAYFLDAISFITPAHGFILGDPINNKFLMLETTNGGETWNTYINTPTALAGEAAFAASNSCINITTANIKFIVTGGLYSEVIISKQNSEWAYHHIPIFKGKSPKGAFSIALNNNNLVIVGGDYQHDAYSDSTACYSIKGGTGWQLSKIPPRGYQSCVEHINGDIFLSTGTPGSNITKDGGITWTKIDSTSFNVCSKSKYGKLVLLAGNDGKIAIYQP